jgi:nuclear transport factor 2 (NTF2) superfamily protein
MLGATQRSDSYPFTVGPHWMIMWLLDPKTTGLPTTQADRRVHHVAGSPHAHLHHGTSIEKGTLKRRNAMSVAKATTQRPPLPPFTRETAIEKVRRAEDAWNSRDPEKVALAYTVDSSWRNRSEFVNGTKEIVAFLGRKWAKELEYRLIKELWAFEGNRIAVRFAYEWHDDSGNWFRSYGNENWEFDENGLMRLRLASINDLPIKETERKYHWAVGRRPDDHPGLSDFGF